MAIPEVEASASTGNPGRAEKNPRRKSLRSAIIVIAAAVTVVVSAVFVAVYYLLFSASFETSLRAKSDVITARLSDTLAIPLWNFSHDVCSRIVASELGEEDLIAVILRDERGKIVVAMERPRGTKEGTADTLPRAIEAERIPVLEASARYSSAAAVRNRDIMIGAVTVLAGGEATFRAFIARLVDGALVAFIVGGLVAVVLFLAVDRLVSQRVFALRRQVGRFAARDFAARAAEGRADEIGDLASAFNLMADTIQRYGEDLEGLVNERTGQLVESEKLAFLGGLVAGIAHEVNTPIGVSVTAASHTKNTLEAITTGYDEGSLDEAFFLSHLRDSIESVGIIELNLARAAEFIRTFKQLAADQAVEEQRRIKLAQYLAEIVLSLRPKLKRTAHTVEIDCPEDLEIVIVPSALYQIVTNLIVNSLMHAFDDGKKGHIRISARRSLGGVELHYKDDGKGIPPEIIGKIFDPFFTTKRELGGTGLGLYIVKTIVLKLDGDASCSSEYGKGVEFTIFLPSEKPGDIDGR
jgi:two-component system NtrC family sensor kinase